MIESEELPLLDALRGLAMLQQEFLRLALFVASEGPATFERETLTCSLGDSQRRTSTFLANHAEAALIYDVLPPMKYESAAAYRRSWDDWQPDTPGESRFDLEELSVTAGSDVAFAHGLIRCGGTLANGKTFQDTVRATFFLCKVDGCWKVLHQHISKPLPVA